MSYGKRRSLNENIDKTTSVGTGSARSASAFFSPRLILNCITNNSIWHTCVTWQGTNYEIPEDGTIVSKRVGVQ